MKHWFTFYLLDYLINFFVALKVSPSQSITGYVAVDHKGSFTAEPGTSILVSSFSNWKNAESFSLSSDTEYVIIRVEKKTNANGGILAEFSNGYVTDSSWRCTDINSTERIRWPAASEVASNNGLHSQWKKVVSNIGTNAKWIWTTNADAGKVWCWKSFGGWKIYAHSYILVLYFSWNVLYIVVSLVSNIMQVKSHDGISCVSIRAQLYTSASRPISTRVSYTVILQK